jgi:sulfoxide reductase heme-binding subunit YedZ
LSRAHTFWNPIRQQWLLVVTHILSLLPLVLLLWDYATGQLTVDPIREITFRTGSTALTLLVLSLACTPLNIVFGLKQVIPLRRWLGLYAFLYASLHFLTFVALDYGLDLALIGEAIFEKRYALVGFAAFLILLPLAITSTKGWMRRLGKNWKRLHRLAYLAAVLAVMHYIWLVKGALGKPLLYAAIVALLLVLRIPAVRKKIIALRYRLTRRGQSVGAS